MSQQRHRLNYSNSPLGHQVFCSCGWSHFERDEDGWEKKMQDEIGRHKKSPTIIVVDGIAFASRDGQLESLTPGECGKAIEQLQINLYDARESIHRVCHALSGTCVMALNSQQHEPCTPANCATMRAAELPPVEPQDQRDSTNALISTLDALIQATQHLLNNYGYDAPGHEVYRDAVAAGKEWLNDLKNLQALNKG